MVPEDALQQYFPELSSVGWEFETESRDSVQYVLDHGYSNDLVLALESAGFRYRHSARGSRVYSTLEGNARASVTDDRAFLEIEYSETEEEDSEFTLFNVDTGLGAGPK